MFHPQCFCRWCGPKRQKGVSSIEYGLLASLIALVAIVGIGALGGANEAGWDAWVARVLAVITGP